MSIPRLVTSAIVSCVLPLAGCADIDDADDVTSADVSVIDRRADALISSSLISYVNGTYTGCKGRTGKWSLAITGTPTMDYSRLSVALGDAACTLAITDIKTTTDGLLSASSPIILGSSYATARAFGSPVKFQANAVLTPANFSGNFSLTLLFSADLTPISSVVDTLYQTVSSTVGSTVSAVAVPNATLAANGVSIVRNLLKNVRSVLGTYDISQGTALADNYVIVYAAVGDTYAEIDTAYQAGTRVALPQSVGAVTSIAASTLVSVTDNLTGGLVRTIIVAKVTNGVSSYKKFTVSFS